ncbi:MAG: thioredoxin family protein [Alloacidobacterium sp.]
MSAVAVNHAVVSQEEWLGARKAFLAEEKKLTRLRDELSRKRRELPWVRVEKNYVFDGPNGKETLSDLFDGRSQLVVYHFMFGPGWGAGCSRCSMGADHFNPSVIHLAQRDVTLIAVSRAPFAEIDAFKRPMGWGFHWVSSYGSDFNYDYRVSFSPEEMANGRFDYNYGLNGFPTDEATGTSVFYKDSENNVFHTYSSYARAAEGMLIPYHFLDIVPKGRDEEDFLPDAMAWVRYHDSYRDLRQGVVQLVE